MDKNKGESEFWKKRKIEAEQKLKKIIHNREKSLILFEQEKEMKRKQSSRLIQLQQLVEYETQEFLRTQAESKYITEKIAVIEKEEKKYHNLKKVFMLSILICSIFLAAMMMNDDQSHDLLPERTDSSRHVSTIQTASHDLFSLLKKYIESNNLITGAVGTPVLVGAAVGASGAGFSTMFSWLLVGMLLGIIGLYTAWRYMNKEKYEEGNRPF